MASTRFNTYNDLVLKIYQAAIEPALWPEITLETSDLMKSGGTQLLVIDNETNIENIAVSTRVPEQSQHEYLTHYMKNDLRVSAILKKDIGELVEDHCLLNEEEATKNREVSQFLTSYGLDNITGYNLSLDNRLIWFGTSRQGKGNIFSAEEVAVMEAIVPHIRKSLRLHLTMQTIQTQAQNLGDLWSFEGKALLCLEQSGMVNFCNALGEAGEKKCDRPARKPALFL